jgi:peptidyl-prolyl cis-trans isomerase SurA
MPDIRHLRSNSLFAVALLGGMLCLNATQPARAQQLLLSVNGQPITSYDVEQRMKLLKILKKPATHDAALEDLISDKVKLDEVSKFTISLAQSDIMAQGSLDAQDAKISPQTFAAELQQSGVDQDNWKEHFKAEAEWNLYVKAMNKTLDISDTEVDAALQARGQKPGVTEYLVRQIVIVTPNPADAQSKAPEAEQIRAQFDGCEKGVVMARAQPNVVVQSLVTRASDTLTDVAKAELEKTAVGHLTSPQQGPEGLEMLALCSRKTVHDDTAVGQPIRDQLLRDRLKKASNDLYAPLRARAVIVHFHS